MEKAWDFLMNDLEKMLVCFVNAYHGQNIYVKNDYHLLRGVRYSKTMNQKYVQMIRDKYPKNCYGAAYELKTYYSENGIYSNTIVLKMRPESPDIQEFRSIKIYSELDEKEYEYTHHAIEIYKEAGKYKVFDILHRNRTVWLEDYLDEVCQTNQCPRNQLRYDMGYLAPSHALADNMQDFSNLMMYLDKQYGIGKPRITYMNVLVPDDKACLISDDMMMDFDALGREFGVTGEEVILGLRKIYPFMVDVRNNLLHLRCNFQALGNQLIGDVIAEAMFDDEKMCRLIEEYMVQRHVVSTE